MHSIHRIFVRYFFYKEVHENEKKENGLISIDNFFFFFCRMFNSIDGQQAIKTKDDLMVLIEQMENDVLTQWSKDVQETIHASTSKNLLMKTEKGLVATNFDQNVSIYLFLTLHLVKSTVYSNTHNVIRIRCYHEAM